MTSKYIGSRSSLPKIATFGPPRAEKLIFSDKTLACSNDCAPKHIHKYTNTKCLKVPKSAIFLKSIGFKDIKYDIPVYQM